MQTKRLGIYRILDNRKALDSYIYFAITGICPYVDKLIVFCDATVSMESISRLLQVSDKIRIKSGGTDIDGEVADVLMSCEIRNYEELLLFDDSIYGPLFNLEPLFLTMLTKQWDFWGLTSANTRTENGYRAQPQSCFIVFKAHSISEIITNTLTVSDGQEDIVSAIISRACDRKLKFETYVKSDGYDLGKPNLNTDYSRQLSYDIIKYQRCPFIRKAGLTEVDTSLAADENAKNALAYITDNTDYDVNMIWENLLHTENVRDLKTAFHLEYILPHNCGDREIKHQLKCAVIIHLYYIELLKYSMEYIANIPEEIDLYFTVSEQCLENKIKDYMKQLGKTNFSIEWKENNRGRDVSALLVTCKNILMKYDILCFIHDKKSLKSSSDFLAGKSWYYNLWDNTLKSRNYILNILHTFSENERLGLLVPPEPCQNSHLHIYGDEWRNNFENTVTLAENLKIKCNLCKEKTPYTLGTVFWCKTKALAPLFQYDFHYEDFPEEPLPMDGTLGHAVERALAYVAQSQGYYTAVCMNPDYAALRCDKMEALIMSRQQQSLMEDRLRKLLRFGNTQVSFLNLLRFCNSAGKLYIYGAGKYGRQCADILQIMNRRYEGFLVTSGKQEQQYVKGHKVKELKELETVESDTGVIIALNRKNCDEVLPFLKKSRIGKIYILSEEQQ